MDLLQTIFNHGWVTVGQ